MIDASLHICGKYVQNSMFLLLGPFDVFTEDISAAVIFNF